MCSLFLDNNNPLLIMLIATITKDLASDNVHEIVICLTSLGQLLSLSMVEGGVTAHVLKLINHTTDLVRKKAILIMQKIKSLKET